MRLRTLHFSGCGFFFQEVEQHVHGGGSGRSKVLVAAIVFLNHAGDDAVGITHGNPDGADDDACLTSVRSAGTGVAADCHGIVRGKEFQAAFNHGANNGFADGSLFGDDFGRNTEEVFLDLIGIADETAFEIVGTSGNGGDGTGDAAGGATFSGGEGLALTPKDFADFFAYEFKI